MTNFNLIDNSGADLIFLQAERLKHALQFEKEKTALKFYMAGKGYKQGLKALGFLEQVELKIPRSMSFLSTRWNHILKKLSSYFFQ